MIDLKPCPFCGRTPVIEDCGTNSYFIRCKCGFSQDKLYPQRCDAIKRWNIRKVAPLKWFPTTEGLPELHRNILFTTSQGYVAEGEYDGMFDEHHAWCQYRWSATLWDDEVIAWMPLPKPYTERTDK